MFLFFFKPFWCESGTWCFTPKGETSEDWSVAITSSVMPFTNGDVAHHLFDIGLVGQLLCSLENQAGLVDKNDAGREHFMKLGLLQPRAQLVSAVLVFVEFLPQELNGCDEKNRWD